MPSGMLWNMLWCDSKEARVGRRGMNGSEGEGGGRGETVACTHNPFALVDAQACLAQDDWDEKLFIRAD